MHPSFINSAGDFSKSSLPRLTHHEGYRKVDGETLAALQQATLQYPVHNLDFSVLPIVRKQ
jgi:hypothetical protein